MLVMYALYGIVSFVLKVIWKKLLVSGVIKMSINRITPLYVVAPQGKLNDVVDHALATDFDCYEVVGNCDESSYSILHLRDYVTSLLVLLA